MLSHFILFWKRKNGKGSEIVNYLKDYMNIRWCNYWHYLLFLYCFSPWFSRFLFLKVPLVSCWLLPLSSHLMRCFVLLLLQGCLASDVPVALILLSVFCDLQYHTSASGPLAVYVPNNLQLLVSLTYRSIKCSIFSRPYLQPRPHFWSRLDIPNCLLVFIC